MLQGHGLTLSELRPRPRPGKVEAGVTDGGLLPSAAIGPSLHRRTKRTARSCTELTTKTDITSPVPGM